MSKDIRIQVCGDVDREKPYEHTFNLLDVVPMAVLQQALVQDPYRGDAQITMKLVVKLQSCNTSGNTCARAVLTYEGG